MAFNIQLEFPSGRKRFAIKTIAPLERAGNKSIDILSWFFFKDAAYDYERVKQSAFYAKRHRARSVARFCWTLLYLNVFACWI